MVRMTIAQCGDPLTFRPVTSSLIRESKDGDIQVVTNLLGSHYNITMDGILQSSMVGNANVDHYLKVEQSKLKLGVRKDGAIIPTKTAAFSSFMYMYPDLTIKGHLQLSESKDSIGPPPLYEIYYLFEDLLSKDAILFYLTRDATKAIFQLVESISGIETILYTVNLATDLKEINFEFVYLENGKSKLYTYTNYLRSNQTRDRVWIGDIKAKVGECGVSANISNESSSVMKEFISEYMYLYYPNVYLKFDREDLACKFIGGIRMWDDMNSLVESEWFEIFSRDYNFVGNRVIENGMIRIIIKTNNPEIEIWGWDYNDSEAWEKVGSILVDSDAGDVSLKVQNIAIRHFSIVQTEIDCNFGTSVYRVLMTKGDPYISLVNQTNTKFRFKSAKTRMGGDFDNKFEMLFNTLSVDNVQELDGTNTRLAQRITNINIQGKKLKYAIVRLKKSASPTGSAQLKIRKTSDDTVIATSANSQDVSLVSLHVDGEDIKFTFADEVVSNEEVYMSLEGGTYSGTNKIAWLGVNTGDSDNGVAYKYAGGWTVLTGKDFRGLIAYEKIIDYSLANTYDDGNLTIRSVATETINNFGLKDNYFAWYNHTLADDVLGFMSNFIQPDSILFENFVSYIKYTFTYPSVGNTFGVGVLPSYPSNLVSGIPFPFIVTSQDNYIKWRGNEAIWAFKEIETFRRR